MAVSRAWDWQVGRACTPEEWGAQNPLQPCMPAPGFYPYTPALISMKNMTGSRKFSKSVAVLQNVRASLSDNPSCTQHTSVVCASGPAGSTFSPLYFPSLVLTSLLVAFSHWHLPSYPPNIYCFTFSTQRKLSLRGFSTPNLNIQRKLKLQFSDVQPFYTPHRLKDCLSWKIIASISSPLWDMTCKLVFP